MTRIIDKINQIQTSEQPSYYSFEFFPPRTEAGTTNLTSRIERMVSRLSPLFVDITWGAGGSTRNQSLGLSSYVQQYCNTDVLLHITCIGLRFRDIRSILDEAKEAGIENVLCLRGDVASIRGPKDDGGDCRYAKDLVSFIRKEYGDYFCLSVAGHPEGCSPNKTQSEDQTEAEIKYLKEKVVCGADFIMTQFFYDPNVLVKYVKRCRAHGITCPIIPGLMPIQSYSSFVRMTEFCGIHVPRSLMDQLQPVKNDDEAVKEIGVEWALSCIDAISQELSCGVHFYTLNLERSVTQIISTLRASISEKTPSSNDLPRILPWRPSTQPKRHAEQIRPINWANRPKSYIMRTEDWDEFPNGRWGDATSPAFGDFTRYHGSGVVHPSSDGQKREVLGHCPVCFGDVQKVFVQYLTSSTERDEASDVPSFLPWCEGEVIQPETLTLQKELQTLNGLGFWTINSQPAVNAVPSLHPIYGWGGKGGYIYQKAYIECFVPPALAHALAKKIKGMSLSWLHMYAVDSDQSKYISVESGNPAPHHHNKDDTVTALTWGVFPDREIVQPTVFDPWTFREVWAEEAFALWTTSWLNLYDLGSDSYDLIQTIRDTFYLVAIIDNDYVATESKIWKVLMEVGKEVMEDNGYEERVMKKPIGLFDGSDWLN